MRVLAMQRAIVTSLVEEAGGLDRRGYAAG
jgi:hypothetical protein